MVTNGYVVDNRVFLLGLDKLYRDAMKRHERGELLACARRVAAPLHETPADVPVEGYYAEDEQLTEVLPPGPGSSKGRREPHTCGSLVTGVPATPSSPCLNPPFLTGAKTKQQPCGCTKNQVV